MGGVGEDLEEIFVAADSAAVFQRAPSFAADPSSTSDYESPARIAVGIVLGAIQSVMHRSPF